MSEPTNPIVQPTNPYNIAHLKKRAFLAAFANSGNIRAACRAVGIGRRTYYDWTEHDEAFGNAVHTAKADYADALEAELTRQVMQDHNTTALIVALKMAGRFVDTSRNEHSGPGGGPIRTETKAVEQFDYDAYRRVFAEHGGGVLPGAPAPDGADEPLDTPLPDA